MNIETNISIFAFVFGAASLFLSFLMFKKIRNQRDLLEFVGKQVEDLETVISKNKESLETNAQRINEQSRRIAWLESRIRQPKIAGEEIIDDTPVSQPQKLNMTERRHRVITLAARGQSAETIAATLGMLTGEVELIINLNQCK
jgi:flagellar biosynthesis/type III secretory pathway chaperone